MPTKEEFAKNMTDPKYRKTLYEGLQAKGFKQPEYNAYESFWSKNTKPTTDEDLAKTFVMSPEWQEDYARGKEVENEIKAEDAKRKQTADAYNAYAKLEDSFAKYEQSQDVSDLFNVGQQEPIFGEDPKKYWRNRVAKRKEGEAQAKAKVDQEREELRQRMQLLKDDPDAYDELYGFKGFDVDKVNLDNLFTFDPTVDKRGNKHDNVFAKAFANQRIDTEDKALQLGMQSQELQDMLADPMALDKEMSKLKAELAELTKQRDAYGSQFAKEHPWQMVANLMGRDSFDNPYEVGMYGVDAMETQMQMNNVIARINMLTEAKNAFERGSWSGHGFWNNVKNIGKGMQQFATEINSYTDKYNIESGMALNNLANKIERGEMLTDEEMSWFVTAKLKEEGEKAASQGPTTGAVGYGAPASLEYMVTMALNPAKGASKTISDKIIEVGVRRFGKSAFTKMMAKATGMLTEGAVLSTTLGVDNVASDALGRMAGKVGFDDGGNVAVADRVNPLKAMYQSTMASTIESAVEMMGVPIIGKATKGIGKVATKLADAMSYGKVSKLLSAMDKSQIVNWTKGMQKATGWHNLGEEWGEENVTMLTNAIIVGDNEIADMFDTRTQLEILGTCALISGAMSTANVAGFAGEFRKVNREYKKAKQEVLRQFSSDVWASLDNLITNAQDEDLTVRLADAMDGMAMNQEQRSAIMNYLTALKRYQKFNELNDGGKFIISGPQQAQATQSTSTYEIDSDITLKDEIGNPIDAHIIGRDANGNYMIESSQPINGKRVQPMSADQLDAMVIPNTPDGIQQSEVDGYNLTDANQQAEVSMLTDNARESVATLLGVTPDAVDATLQQVLGDNPTDAKIDARFGSNAQVVKDYMYNVAKTKGMSARLIDDIADATAESDRAIDAVDNNGNVVTAKDAEGNDVNVVSGNIVTFEDGVIDVANSDASVVIRHEDGVTEMVAPTSLTEVVSMPTEQAKTEQAQAIAQQMQQAFSDKLNGALDYSQGQQYTMLNADGSTTDVTILADNGDGNVTVTARDGNKEGGVTDGKQIVLPKSQIQQGVREFKRNQLRGETAQQTSIPQESQPTEVAEPTQEPSMPTDEQGNIMYEQMDADSAWDALLAETGGDADMAMTVANEMIADKTKAVEEASKMVAQPGATPQEKIANLKAVKQAQVQAQAELDAWKAIAETPHRRMSLQAEQAEQTDLQGQQVADKLPSSEEVTTETPTESAPQVGLVEDARTRTLGDKTRKMLDAMAKRLGLQVEFVDEIVTGKDEKGRNLYANAVIVGKNVKIAWHNRNRAIDFLLGHEFTHRMQDLSPEAYAEFVEATKQALGEEEWNKRIKRMRDIYKSQGKTISEQGIINEVVADYAGELVEERGVFDNFVERNNNNRSLLSKIADVLRSIKEFFSVGKQRKINNAIARLEALIESASEVVTSVADVAETDSEIPRFNLATEGEVATKLRDFVESKEGRALGWTQEQMEQMINETEWLINSIDSALQGDTNYEEWRERKPTITTDWRDGETKPTVTWSRGNIEYKYDMSADLLCINNEGLESVLSSPIMAELMTKAMPNFTSNDYSTLYQVLKDKGFVVPCAGCFDFAMRLKMLPSVAQKFVQLTNEVIDERNKNPEAFDEMIRQRAKEGKQTVEGLPISASDKKKAIELAVVGDNLTEHLDWHDFLSAEGQTEILSKYGGLFRAWQRTGAGRPKDKLLPEPWIGEMASPRIGTIIAPLDAKTPSYRADDVNVGTGLRRNSHSEYRPALVVDEIQMMREAFVKNLLVFKYMKELDDVRMFGELGVKYNMSFFPAFDPNGVAAGLDANGEYIASEESVGAREFEYTDADGKIHYDGMKGRDEALKYTNENVSLSAVAFSVPHLIKLMTDVPTPQKPDGWVGSIIGYHAGGATASQMAKQGLGKARAASPDASKGAFEVEAMTDYNKGVTNFEQVQNDRFGEGWVVVEGKKAGEKVSKGHKLEFVNGKHYYNESLGVHLFSNGYVYDSELPNGKVTADIKKNPPHPLTIDYNDKVRELNSDYGYMEASDYYTEELHKIGMIPRFEFVVPEDIFLQMCADAKRSPYDPNLGWKGKGHDWNPSDAPAYYALWCDYGMTVPGTGKWSPHRPVGYIDAYGNRSFRLPENVVDIAKDAMSRYTDRRNRENAMTNDAIVEFCKRSIDLGAMDEKKAEDILNKNGFSLNDNPTPPQKTRFSLTGEEQSIVDEAKANGTYLKAPNGKASNLNERQWIQVRTKAFKDWFGDWELAYLYNRALTAWNDKNSKGKVVIALSEKAKLRFNELLGKDIKQFILTDDSIRHIKSNHSQREELRGQKNMTPEDVVIIPYLVNNFDSMDLKPEYDDKLGNRAIEITKRINGISVVATIEKGNNKEFLVTNYELIKSDALDATNKTPGLYVRNDSDIAKVQKDIETIKQKANNSSKVVDENGEPKVVYKRIPEAVNEFNTEFGQFFSSEPIEDLSFGDYVGEYFLNIREPLQLDAQGTSWSYPLWMMLADENDELPHSDEEYNKIIKKRNLLEFAPKEIWDIVREDSEELDFEDAINIIKRYGLPYNGAIVRNIGEGTEGNQVMDDYIVMQPTQIKSATDNVGTFDASNPDIRYSLATDMARDAVMTALEGAGIDVEMATPEMVEDVLRARDVEFHIAYHGSGAKFDEFDHSHMGEGEGAQAYGWGTYLTEVEGIAKMYAGANGAAMLTYKGNELDTDGLLNQWRVIKDLYDENKGRLREMRNRAERILSLVEEDNTEMKQLWQSVVDTLKQVRAGDLKVKPKRNLYTVEIPDDTGKNYLDYDKEMSKKELNEVRNKLEAILAEGDYKGVEKELKRELDSVFVDGLTASDVYGNVSAYLGGDKQASEFFNEMGYVGIKYPANYRSGGNEDGKKNFVIFNDSDMKITDRVEFLQTPDGTVYGWTIGGKIFLTEQGMNAETPIHEYTHLWANAMRRNNEQGWESIKDLLRGTPMWDEVLADKNYSNIHDNEDLVASEVLSRYSGKENAKRLEDEAQRMIDEARGIGAKADAVSLIDRVRRALQKFWNWVGKDLFSIKDFDSIEQVTDRVLYDLMNQTDLNAEVSEGEANKTKFSLQGGRSIADKYEKKVNTKGKGGAMHLSKFNFMEAWQDEMRALKEVQRIIEQEYGIVLESYEDAYMAENAMSSIAKASWDRYINEVYEPMMRIHDEWIRSGESNESINHYLIAKSGLERNREFTVRDAFRAERASMEEPIRDAYHSAIKDLNEKYKPMELDLLNQYRSGAIDKDTYRNERKNLSDAKKAERKPIDDKYQLDMQDIHDKMTQVEEEYKAKRNALRDDLKAGNIGFAEFCRLSDDLALQYSGAEEIADYSGLTALAKIYGRDDFYNFAMGMVDAFERRHSNTDVMWEHINNNTKSAVDYSYKSGITSKQAKEHLDQMFVWYVPMKGNADVEAEDIYTYVNDKSSSFTPTVARAKGHTEYVSEDVMALIANTMQSAILQGERNKVKQKFLNMVQNYPTDLFSVDNGWLELQGNDWVEVFPDINENDTPEEVRSKIEDFQEKMQELANEGKAKRKSEALSLGVPFRATQNKSEHAISVMRNGEKMTIYVNGNPRVAQAVNGKLKDTKESLGMRLWHTFTRWLSAGMTGYSIDFTGANLSRDIHHSSAIMFLKYGFKEQIRYILNGFADLPALIRGISGKSGNTKRDAYFQEFLANGGETGYANLRSLDDWKVENKRRIGRLRTMGGRAWGHTRNVLPYIAEAFGYINRLAETSSRFNAYVRARERNQDVATAVSEAKNITVNFNKKGSAKTAGVFGWLANLYRETMMFANPVIQGLYQFLKVGKEHKSRFTVLCLGHVALGGVVPILNQMLFELLGGDEEDEYYNQSEYQRRTNLLIYTGHGYIKIPLAPIFRELYALGDVFYGVIQKKIKMEDGAKDVVGLVRSMFSIEGQSAIDDDWSLVRFILPEQLSVVADISDNVNFMGMPIYKDSDYLRFEPEYKKVYKNAWTPFVEVSAKLNELLGGDEDSAPRGVNDKWLNPAIWQHVISSIGGGPLKTIGDVLDITDRSGEDLSISNIPVAKRFFMKPDERTLINAVNNDYYKLKEDMAWVEDRVRKLNTKEYSGYAGAAEKLDFMYHSPDYLKYIIFKDGNKEIEELDKEIKTATDEDEIQNLKTMSAIKKDQLISEIEAVDRILKGGEQTSEYDSLLSYHISKDIVKKMRKRLKEIQIKEVQNPGTLKAYKKTPEYDLYVDINKSVNAINRIDRDLKDETTYRTPAQTIRLQKRRKKNMDTLVELIKAYESIGEIKE